MFYYYVILILLFGVCIYVYDRRGRHSWLAVLSVGSGVTSPILEANTLEEALKLRRQGHARNRPEAGQKIPSDRRQIGRRWRQCLILHNMFQSKELM